MTCDRFRQLISQRIDGELPAESVSTVDAHLANCTACTMYQDDAWSLQRSLRVTAAVEPAGRSASLTPAHVVGPAGAASPLRWMLGVVGATLVVLNLQAMFGAGESLEPHLSRHGAVFGAALGIGMLIVAARPHRAIGLVPLTSTIAVLMLVSSLIDLASDQATMLGEAIHVVELAGLACLWVISGGPARWSDRYVVAMQRLRRRTVHSWPTV